MDAPLYNAEILRLAASIPNLGRLADPGATVVRSSPICGSRVTADVTVDRDGAILAFGQEVRACALGQAAAAILGGNVLGHQSADLDDAAAQLGGWLKGDGPLPDTLSANWPRLALFEPARAHPARHASILLAFQAAAAAAAQAAALQEAG